LTKYNKEETTAMRLKRLIAEYLYLKENTSITPFEKTSSNKQDAYCRAANQEIPALLHGYISSRGWLGNLVRGCIQEFMNAHGTLLTKQNYDSLAKRIISKLEGEDIVDNNK